jgi:hypothetical protein
VPKTPNVTLGPVAAPVARTGGQVITGAFIVQGLTVFGVPLDTAQSTWLAAALSVGVSALQNWWERRRGRKLIGTAT